MAASQAAHTDPNHSSGPADQRGHGTPQPGYGPESPPVAVGAASSFYNEYHNAMPAPGQHTPSHDANATNYYGGAAAAVAGGEVGKPAKEEKKKEKKSAGGLLMGGAAGLIAGGLLTHALGK